MSRHAARLAAVEVLYAADVRSIPAADVLDERNDIDDYCRELVTAVDLRRSELDGVLGRHAHGWTTDRMSAVDRNVLRVAVVELTGGDVPAAAAIDEAVSLAKRLSGEEAGRFVNGVLEAVRQEVGSADPAGGL